MKKFCILIICFMLSMTVSAELKYFKFMGIPMGQNIESFSRALKNKGFTISPDNEYYDLGTRVFEGYFFDERSKVFVLYEKPKELRNVYTVAVQIKGSSKDYLQRLGNKIQEIIENKYFYNYHYLDKNSSIKLPCEYNIYNSKDEEDVFPVGRISIDVSYSETESCYELTIFYKDFMLCVLNEMGKELDV